MRVRDVCGRLVNWRRRREATLVARAYLLIVVVMSWPIPARTGSHVQDVGATR